MNRPVIDASGLTGLFDIDLQFSTEPQSGPGGDWRGLGRPTQWIQ